MIHYLGKSKTMCQIIELYCCGELLSSFLQTYGHQNSPDDLNVVDSNMGRDA